MVKPLISNDPNPKDTRFSHFGVLDDGKRSKGAAITSISINVGIALIIVVLGMIVKTNPQLANKITQLTLPPKPPEVKPAPKPPPPPPPKPLPKPPDIIKLEPPKIKPPELIKPPTPELKPLPVNVPKPVVLNTPAPKAVTPPPAPAAVSLKPMAASIQNNDAHPSAVRLGNPEIKALSGKPVGATPVNLAGGMHNMPPSNVGSGPPSGKVNLGSGAPASQDVYGKGAGAVVIKGLSNGTPGGTGKGGPQSVAIAAAPPAAVIKAAPPAALPPPKLVVVSKPRPSYTPEATAMHLEGTVTLHIKVKTDGSVEVLGVVHGLGHGLDQSAIEAMKATRFKPPVDGSGKPIEMETNAGVVFQMS